MRGHISKLQALLNVAAQILALAPEVDGLVQRRAQRMAHRSNRITGDHHAERRRTVARGRNLPTDVASAGEGRG